MGRPITDYDPTQGKPFSRKPNFEHRAGWHNLPKTFLGLKEGVILGSVAVVIYYASSLFGSKKSDHHDSHGKDHHHKEQHHKEEHHKH